MKFVIASANPGKLKEFQAILEPLGYEVLSTADYGLDMDAVIEDGATFADNALLKAQYAYDRIGEWVLADDSGLCIDALPDILGVHTARFLGHDTSQTLKNQTILERMQGMENRQASFYSVIALVNGTGSKTFTGRADGVVATEIQGAGGFGYDPLFIPDGYVKSYAELPVSVKNTISHRALALQALLTYLQGVQ